MCHRLVLSQRFLLIRSCCRSGNLAIDRQSVSAKQASTPNRTMCSVGWSMWLSLLFLTLFTFVLDAREQHIFSLDTLETVLEQRISLQHYQPWSLLLSQNVSTSNCIVLQSPALAQTHKSIKEFGDVLVLNKAPSNVRGGECVEDSILEILGFDQRSIWMKVSELCSTIGYKYSDDIAPLAEYEVVYSLSYMC